MNRTVSLLRYASVPGKGWRRGAVVMTRNGKLKPDVMLVSGTEVHCPNGRYRMRQYQGKNPVYTELGTDPIYCMQSTCCFMMPAVTLFRFPPFFKSCTLTTPRTSVRLKHVRRCWRFNFTDTWSE
jgi:hypothetical protein